MRAKASVSLSMNPKCHAHRRPAVRVAGSRVEQVITEHAERQPVCRAHTTNTVEEVLLHHPPAAFELRNRVKVLERTRLRPKSGAATLEALSSEFVRMVASEVCRPHQTHGQSNVRNRVNVARPRLHSAGCEHFLHRVQMQSHQGACAASPQST